MARYDNILNREERDYYGNIPDLIELLKSELGMICPLNKIRFVQGRYEETLSKLNLGFPLHFVHIDCDWYESTRTVLEYLQNNLHPGALLQIDDYHTWQGSKRAVDEAIWLQKYCMRDVGDALVIDTSKNAV
jgi:hypothetical protein